MTGFFNIDKEEGRSSGYVVNILKKLTHTPCGHMGTLDPLASGVLPVGAGNATRLFDFFLKKEKTYTARFRFGATTPTLDREGELEYGGEIPSEQDILRALPKLTGEIEQIPPAYSAVSVNGRRGYALARAGETFEIPAKKVSVFEFRLTGRTDEDEYSFLIRCGSGTYIRSLARDLAALLGTLGYMSYLRRTQSGAFAEETAVPLSELTRENAEKYLIPTDAVIDLPALTVCDERLYHGIPVAADCADGLYKLYREDGFYGLARVRDGVVKTEKKLC